MKGIVTVLGRVLLSAIFLTSAAGKIMDVKGTVEYMESAGIPNANILIWAAVAAEIVGGLSILLGWYARLGALGLLVFLGVAAYYFHAFWKMPADTTEAAMAQKNQMAHFMKNVALMGAMLFVLANGAGPMSVDACCEPRTAKS
jgi:putative oxidoreductase